MKETIELDEGYWQALLLDAEACRPETEPERSAERATSGSSRPLDLLWEIARQACDADEARNTDACQFR